MKKWYKTALAIVVIFAAAFCITSFTTKKPVKFKAGNGFAVIELFTSEGCSSCPPADNLIAKIQRESVDKPVYILAFHVDYWDRLGWKDPFSSHDYSNRQYQYANWLHLNGVYTPQAVVNGRKEMIGSDAGKLNDAVKNSIENSALGNLKLANLKLNGNQATLQFETSVKPENEMLVMAIVQKAATINVKNGENGGRTLNHVQIVRKLMLQNLDGKQNGNAAIALPTGVEKQNLELIAFVQNKNTGEISAATKLVLNSASSSENAIASTNN